MSDELLKEKLRLIEESRVPETPAPPRRKLAYIREISDISHICSSSEKVVATVDGWKVAVDPRMFNKGDLALFIEIDAFLPAADKRFKSLGALQIYNEIPGYRVQTRVFGSGKNKVLSQGILLPLADFPEVNDTIQILRDGLSWLKSKEVIKKLILMFHEGMDFSELLKITKWVEPEEKTVSQLGHFPTLIHKTNHERVQKCPNLFTKAKYKHRVYQESVKMDGTSMTVYFVNNGNEAAYRSLHRMHPGCVGAHMIWPNGRFGVCSHHHDLNELGDSMYWAAARAAGLPAKLARLGRSVAVQGELCGDGIHRNREGLPPGAREFFVFAIWDIDRQAYLHPRETERRAGELGLKHVPVLGYVRIRDIASSQDDLLQRAARRDGEGLVFKCVQDGRWFKVISNTYLLENDL